MNPIPPGQRDAWDRIVAQRVQTLEADYRKNCEELSRPANDAHIFRITSEARMQFGLLGALAFSATPLDQFAQTQTLTLKQIRSRLEEIGEYLGALSIDDAQARDVHHAVQDALAAKVALHREQSMPTHGTRLGQAASYELHEKERHAVSDEHSALATNTLWRMNEPWAKTLAAKTCRKWHLPVQDEYFKPILGFFHEELIETLKTYDPAKGSFSTALGARFTRGVSRQMDAWRNPKGPTERQFNHDDGFVSPASDNPLTSLMIDESRANIAAALARVQQTHPHYAEILNLYYGFDGNPPLTTGEIAPLLRNQKTGEFGITTAATKQMLEFAKECFYTTYRELFGSLHNAVLEHFSVDIPGHADTGADSDPQWVANFYDKRNRITEKRRRGGPEVG